MTIRVIKKNKRYHCRGHCAAIQSDNITCLLQYIIESCQNIQNFIVFIYCYFSIK